MVSQTFCYWDKQQSADSNIIQIHLTLKCRKDQSFHFCDCFLVSKWVFQHHDHCLTSGVASTNIFWGGAKCKILDEWHYFFGKTPLKSQNNYIFQKFWGSMAPLAPSRLRLCVWLNVTQDRRNPGVCRHKQL